MASLIHIECNYPLPAPLPFVPSLPSLEEDVVEGPLAARRQTPKARGSVLEAALAAYHVLLVLDVRWGRCSMQQLGFSDWPGRGASGSKRTVGLPALTAGLERCGRRGDSAGGRCRKTDGIMGLGRATNLHPSARCKRHRRATFRLVDPGLFRLFCCCATNDGALLPCLSSLRGAGREAQISVLYSGSGATAVRCYAMLPTTVLRVCTGR